MSTTTTADRLADFSERHGYTVINALQVYSERMRRESDQTMQAWSSVKDDPEARKAQDASMITTAGLYQSARMFGEAADRADEALTAWQELTDPDDEDN